MFRTGLRAPAGVVLLMGGVETGRLEAKVVLSHDQVAPEQHLPLPQLIQAVNMIFNSIDGCADQHLDVDHAGVERFDNGTAGSGVHVFAAVEDKCICRLQGCVTG